MHSLLAAVWLIGLCVLMRQVMTTTVVIGRGDVIRFPTLSCRCARSGHGTQGSQARRPRFVFVLASSLHRLASRPTALSLEFASFNSVLWVDSNELSFYLS
jgi:hypothetical protein